MAFCKKQIFQRRWTWLLGCVLFCCMPGCGAAPVWQRENPEVVLTGFLETAEVQDTETMWEFLDAQTRDALQKKADAFNASAENGHPRKAWEMLRPGHVMATTREYKKIKPQTVTDTTAVVSIVLHDDSEITVTMQRENNRWTVALPL